MALAVLLLVFRRKRTSTGLIMYALCLYFLGLSFRSTAKASDPFVEKRSHIVVLNRVQLFNPNKFYLNQTRVTALIIDETMLQIGSDYAWLWVAIEPVHKQVLGVYVSRHKNILRSLIEVYGKHTVSSDGGTWYPEAYSYLGLEHLLHSPLEKSIIERTIEYFKDRTEAFDDYYPCKHRIDYDLSHANNWFGLFVFMHNVGIPHIKFMKLVRMMRGERA